jgi:hypothetical protein
MLFSLIPTTDENYRRSIEHKNRLCEFAETINKVLYKETKSMPEPTTEKEGEEQEMKWIMDHGRNGDR